MLADEMQASRCVGTALQEGDDVEFVRQVHRRSGAIHAVDLKLNSRATDRCELGQVLQRVSHPDKWSTFVASDWSIAWHLSSLHAVIANG